MLCSNKRILKSSVSAIVILAEICEFCCLFIYRDYNDGSIEKHENQVFLYSISKHKNNRLNLNYKVCIHLVISFFLLINFKRKMLT